MKADSLEYIQSFSDIHCCLSNGNVIWMLYTDVAIQEDQEGKRGRGVYIIGHIHQGANLVCLPPFLLLT